MLTHVATFLAWTSVPAAFVLMAVQTQTAIDLNSLIEQLPFVVLIIYVIELRDRRWQEMMRTRDAQWQEFYKDQQVQHKESMAEVAVALAKVADQSAKTHELMSLHDQRVKSAIPKMQEAYRGQDQGGT